MRNGSTIRFTDRFTKTARAPSVDGIPGVGFCPRLRIGVSARFDSRGNSRAPDEASACSARRRSGSLLRSGSSRGPRAAGNALRRVINATGVVLHTNLGRAPLGTQDLISGYSNLEYDLSSGRRGKRDVHTGRLLEALLGAPGIVVNNNAAAVYLALHELAAGYEVIVSRGELIEIGDGFRIPEIMQRSGAILREVGTTNRTHIDDYREAITERTRLLLRVHPSNFRIEGFTARPSLKELVALGKDTGIPVYEDLGSGCLFDMRPYGIDEPLVADSLRDGAGSGQLQRRQTAGRSASRHPGGEAGARQPAAPQSDVPGAARG